MIGSKPGILVKLCWGIITPVLMLAIFLFNMYNYAPASYEGYSYPLWADLLGWCLSFMSILMVPIFAVVEIVTAQGNTWYEVRESFYIDIFLGQLFPILCLLSLSLSALKFKRKDEDNFIQTLYFQPAILRLRGKARKITMAAFKSPYVGVRPEVISILTENHF